MYFKVSILIHWEIWLGKVNLFPQNLLTPVVYLVYSINCLIITIRVHINSQSPPNDSHSPDMLYKPQLLNKHCFHPTCTHSLYPGLGTFIMKFIFQSAMYTILYDLIYQQITCMYHNSSSYHRHTCTYTYRYTYNILPTFSELGGIPGLFYRYYSKLHPP